MKKRRKSSEAISATSSVRLSSDRRIILLDQELLRGEIGRSTRKKIAEMEKLTISLEEFEKKILPAYERWELEIIGPLLNEERQLQAKMARLESLMGHASLESLFTGRDPHEIFLEVAREETEWEEQNARSDDKTQDIPPWEEFDSDAEREFPDEEREFRAYVRFTIGDDPDEYGKREYKRCFREYQDWKQRRAEENSSIGRKKQDVPARVKELYRILVRRLHPDAGRSTDNLTVRCFWHDLQDAYANMDVERLELLLALTDLYETGSANRSTLFHLRKIAKQMDHSVRDLKARLRQARTSPAWAFWHCDNRDEVAAKMRRETEARIRKSKRAIGELEEELENWKRNSPKRKKKRPPLGGSNSAATLSRDLKSHPRKPNRESPSQGIFDF